NARQRRSRKESVVEHRSPDQARRSEIRNGVARRLRMVARQSGEIRFNQTLPCGFVFADLWPDRSAPDRGMDSGRQTRCPFPTPDAQVHLDAHSARSLAMQPKLWIVISRPDRLPNALV